MGGDDRTRPLTARRSTCSSPAATVDTKPNGPSARTERGRKSPRPRERRTAELYRAIASDNQANDIVVYVSTGPWNVAPAIDGFLQRHGYPPGPLLLTDWGPTLDGWFRSGRAHKRAELRRLITELPQVSWILVGDDGQHDEELYREVAGAAPDRVRAIAIRELTTTEQIRTHGSPDPPTSEHEKRPAPPMVVEVRGPNGSALMNALRAHGVLRARVREIASASTTTPSESL